MNIHEIYTKFPTKDACILHLEQVRWNGTPICPYCGSDKSSPLPKEKRHHCNTCNISYSVTVGTIFHDTKLPLQKWFLMMSFMVDALKSVSARQIARQVGVNKDTAHKNMMKVRKAMIEHEWMGGIVEIDETLVGGKNKNRHMDKKIPGGQGGHSPDKTAVIGLKERETGKLKAMKITNRKGTTLKPIVHQNVEKGSTVMTDEHTGYKGLNKHYDHQTCNHGAGQYVIGDIHTNSIEGEWSLFKRGVMGQWHNISDKYINQYLNEFCFRANNRNNPNTFGLLLNNALGV